MSEPANNQPLTVSVHNRELIIRVGIDVLASAVTSGNAFHQFDEEKDEYLRNFAVKDSEQFAKDVAIALTSEEEDGSTPISLLLDHMAQAAIDDGSEGVEYNQEIKFDEKSPLETWVDD